MLWNTYRLGMIPTAAERREFGAAKITPEELDQDLTWFRAVAAAESMKAEASVIGLHAEQAYWYAGQPTLFVENKNLVKFLLDVKLDIEWHEAFFSPVSNTRSLALPSGTVHNGVEIPPILVYILREADYGKPLNHIRSLSTTGPIKRVGVVLRVSFVSYFVVCFRSAREVQYFLDHGRHPDRTLDNSDEPTSAETTQLVTATRLLLALCVYARVFPEAIYDGVPMELRKREARILKRGGVSKLSTCQLIPKLRQAPVAHYRTWFFRTYKHERYKRNSDGSCKVQLIGPTFVRGRDPKTAQRVSIGSQPVIQSEEAQ